MRYGVVLGVMLCMCCGMAGDSVVTVTPEGKAFWTYETGPGAWATVGPDGGLPIWTLEASAPIFNPWPGDDDEDE